MGYFKKVRYLLSKELNEKLEGEELKGEIMKFNKIYEYSIELLLTIIFIRGFQIDLINKKEEFSPNLYDSKNLKVLLDILQDKEINIHNVLMKLVGLKKEEQVEESDGEHQARILDKMTNSSLAGGVLKKQREKYKRTNFKKKVGNNRKTRSIKKASKRYLLSKYLNKAPKQKRKSSLRHKKCKKKV